MMRTPLSCSNTACIELNKGEGAESDTSTMHVSDMDELKEGGKAKVKAGSRQQKAKKGAFHFVLAIALCFLPSLSSLFFPSFFSSILSPFSRLVLVSSCSKGLSIEHFSTRI
uniref:Uncharacterized protein n=1 Tax=Palpitomonas bilix TaxID=652834 RepID=A0A7S3DHV0_9EUKA